MLVKTYGCAIHGIGAVLITVECDVKKGNQRVVVGLPDNAVKESLYRVESAITNSHYFMPPSQIVFSLAPADMKKTGSSFDLPMAVALLAASGQILNPDNLSSYVILGELGLSGEIGKIKGALPAAMETWKHGFKGLLVPEENAREAGMITKLPVYGVKQLADVVDFLCGTKTIEPIKVNTREDFFSTQYDFDIDFADVKGQDTIKRALEIAAAGGHNAILIGPPGSGKSMLAQRLPTILPPLSLDEALETTRIYSVGEKTVAHLNGLLSKRPFRSPHHSISNVALVGGGSFPKPGEISMAHNGVLFLDELPEFNRNVLEVLRQPMEERRVTISRSMMSVEFPANFMLIASMNLCPCGYFNHPTQHCTCSPNTIQKYLNKISGPLLDRIDLHVEVRPVPMHLLNKEKAETGSEAIREKVIAARKVQAHRFESNNGVYTNTGMNSAQLQKYCILSAEGKLLLQHAMERLNFSARAYDRILKVSRTIADLALSEEILPVHLSEAINYRTLDKQGLTENLGDKNGTRAKTIGKSIA